ncbi:MAG TPA: AraC family transcriptional regulator [Thermoanaerobaculia bacterium]|nr:AraC family transcriptional regulator [Thermoanaerobaculia bacterium]
MQTLVPLFGRVVATMQSARARIAEHEYPAGLHAAAHMHEHSYLTLIVDGSLTERFSHRAERFGRGDVQFMRAGEVHSNEYEMPTRCMHVEVDDGAFVTGPLRDPRSSFLAAMIRDEFQQRDDLAPLAIDGLLFALLARSARKRFDDAPRWFARVREAVHASFREKVTLDELSRIAGVHAAHVCREFHRRTGRTIGAYIRELRIAHACRLLDGSSASLAEIALECGFADQSHFASAFRRTMGMTPGRYRAR